MIFTHHGDYGDVVYSLMATKFLCEEAATPCTFYLCPAGDTRVRMSAEHAEGLLPLLRAQPYIARAEWRERPLGVRSDVGQRRFWQHGFNIADQHAHWLGVPYSGDLAAAKPPGRWLAVEPNTMAPVVFARSQRYRNSRFPWRELHARFGSRACFVGTHQEHADFQACVGPVAFVPTPTVLDVARVIAGCRLFVGNQSCPRAIAEGLKVPCVVEVQQVSPAGHQGTHFARPDAWCNHVPPANFAVE